MGAMGDGRGLLCSASDDPEGGVALNGYSREPGQRGELLRDVRGRVVIAGFFGQEQNDFARSLAAACRTIGCCWGEEIGDSGTRDAMSCVGETILQCFR